MRNQTVHVKKLALFIVFCALGVVLSQFTSFAVFGTLANPTQHMINAIVAVLLGPFWAVGAAITIGVTRNMMGTGTLYAFPGGIPGGIVVGVSYWLLKRFKLTEKKSLTAALTEPIGTLLIGVPLSLYLFAPMLGTSSMIGLTKEGPLIAFSSLSAGWAVSCITGCILGFVILVVLNRIGISREKLFGTK